jgi:hypothetical protein
MEVMYGHLLACKEGLNRQSKPAPLLRIRASRPRTPIARSTAGVAAIPRQPIREEQACPSTHTMAATNKCLAQSNKSADGNVG